MTLAGEHVLLRAYLQSADRAPHIPTYEMLLRAARHHKLAGATILRGILGLGRHGIIPPPNFSLVRHEPVIVEIVDTGEKIADFLNGPLHEMKFDGMLTLERAAVMMYRQRKQAQPNALKLAAPLAPLSTLPELPSRSPLMKINENGVLLRVFIGESDRHENKPLYQSIVQTARQLGLAGATVLRGSEGFGANSIVHKASLLDMSSDLPIVIEIVDTREIIEALLPHLKSMVKEGMITMEYVLIIAYRHDPADAPAA
jgi:hypothetical protein